MREFPFMVILFRGDEPWAAHCRTFFVAYYGTAKIFWGQMRDRTRAIRGCRMRQRFAPVLLPGFAACDVADGGCNTGRGTERFGGAAARCGAGARNQSFQLVCEQL